MRGERVERPLVAGGVVRRALLSGRPSGDRREDRDDAALPGDQDVVGRNPWCARRACLELVSLVPAEAVGGLGREPGAHIGAGESRRASQTTVAVWQEPAVNDGGVLGGGKEVEHLGDVRPAAV